MIVISDTSPIRGLVSIGQVGLLKQLFGEIIIPPAVKDELLRIKAIKYDFTSFFDLDWIIIKEIKDKKALEELTIHLDLGESETIVLAKELNCDLILMDETKGRKISKSLEIDTLGLIGILISGKKARFLKEIKPFIDELREKYNFWINNDLYLKILDEVNE